MAIENMTCLKENMSTELKHDNYQTKVSNDV